MDINEGEMNIFADLNLQEIELEEKKKPTKSKAKAKKSKPEPADDEDEVKPEKKTKKKVSLESVSLEESEKKQALLMILSHYANSKRFSSYLKKSGFKNLTSTSQHKKTIAELEDLVSRVKYACANKSSETSDEMIKFVMKGTESLITGVSGGKLDVISTTDECFKDENFLDLLEQMKIEYLSFGRMSLPTRFAMSIAGIGYGVAMKKRLRKIQSENADLLAVPDAKPDVKQQKESVETPEIVVNVPNFEEERK